MLLAIPLYAIGLLLAVSPQDIRRLTWPLGLIWMLICNIVIGIHIMLVLSDTQAQNADYYNYANALENTSTIGSGAYEPGFNLLLILTSTLSSAPESLYIIALLVMSTCLTVLLHILFKNSDWPIVYIVYLNFFSFYDALNAIRQGICISIILLAAGYIIKRRYILAFVIMCFSVTIHHSGIFGFLAFIIRLRVLTVWRCFCVAAALFLSSIVGVNEIIVNSVLEIFGVSPLESFTIYYENPISAGYYGGVNRVDFFLFSSLPIVPYALGYLSIIYSRESAQWPIYEKILIIYLSWLMPFCLLAFLTFSDRIALLAWMFMPITIAWPLLYLNGEEMTGGVTVVRNIVVLFAVFFPNVISYRETLGTICEALAR